MKILVFVLIAFFSPMSFSGPKFDSQESLEVRKILKKEAWQNSVAKKELKSLIVKISDLDRLEEMRISKMSGSKKGLIKKADDSVELKIQDVSDFVRNSHISKIDPDFSKAFLRKISDLNRTRRDHKSNDVPRSVAGSPSVSSYEGKNKIEEISRFLENYRDVVER